MLPLNMKNATRVQVHHNGQGDMRLTIHMTNEIVCIEIGSELALAMFDAMVPIYAQG